MNSSGLADFRTSDVFDYEDLFENGAIGLHFVAGDGTILRANKAELAMLGYAADAYVGRDIRAFYVDADVIEDMLRRLAAGERLDKQLVRMRASDGSTKFVQVSSSGLFKNGQFVHTRCFSVDVTSQKQAEERLEEIESRSRALLEALPIAIYTTDAEGRLTYFNEAARRLAGRSPELGVDRWCVTWQLYWPDGTPLPHDECPMALALREGRELRGVEAVAERPDGTRLTFMPHPTVLRNRKGDVIGAINALVDMSERKHAEEQQRVLINELNHRVKNTLATIQSISLHTQKSTPEDFVDRFEGRLLSLSRAHDLLTHRNWVGVDLGELLQQEFRPYSEDGDDTITIEGPDLTLSSQTALSFGMVLHELTTNAAKYGALTSATGRVRVSWTIEDGSNGACVALQWLERNGPPVCAPTRVGFGRQLIERTIRNDLSGTVDLRFQETGLECLLSFPLS
jgi:PAS domain S-box-containing protein